MSDNTKISSRFHPCLRAIALVTAVVFALSDIALAQPQVAKPTPQPVHIETLPELETVSLPDDYGTIQESFEGDRENSAVILIQDAHAIPHAQRNIHRIIRHFQSEYGVRHVALEGAASEVDLELLKQFPDPEKLQGVLDDYFNRGELAGGVAAAILDDTSSSYYGIEDWNLYEEGLGYYQKALTKEEEISQSIRIQQKTLIEEKQRTYSEELFKVDQTVEAFYADEIDLIELIKTLAKIKAPKASSLKALLHEFEETSQMDFDLEIHGLLKEIAEEQKTKEFNAKHQAYLISQITPADFALFLKQSFPKLKVSEKLALRMRNLERVQAIEGTEFFEELEAYIEKTKQSFFRNEAERKLNQETKDLRIREKLSKLELTHKEWEGLKRKLQINEYASSPRGLSKRQFQKQAETQSIKSLKTVHHHPSLSSSLGGDLGQQFQATTKNSMRNPPIASLAKREKGLNQTVAKAAPAMSSTIRKSDLETIFRRYGSNMKESLSKPSEGVKNNNHILYDLNEYQDHQRFYLNAEARDAAFLKNLRITNHAPRATILVAGGFHTQNLIAKFKEQGISYLLVTPSIDTIPDQSAYRSQMQGDVSWKDYFRVKDGKVNLHDAFVRGMRDALLNDSDLKILKRWRDNVLRALATREDLALSKEYTRFLDELSKNTKRELGKKWRNNVDQFIEELRGLESRGELTQRNIASLLQPATIQSAFIVPGKRSEVRVGYINLLGLRHAVSDPSAALAKALQDVQSLYRYQGMTDDAMPLLRRFSRFKLGSLTASRGFARELAEAIREKHGAGIESHPKDWIVISPPYRTIKSASDFLGAHVAEELGLEFMALRIETPVSKNYAAMKTREERIANWKKGKIFYDRTLEIEGMNVLYIDDLVNTGTSLGLVRQALEERQIASFQAFTILKLDPLKSQPQDEDRINSLLLEGAHWDGLADLIEKPDFVMNRYVLLKLFSLSMPLFDRLIRSLSDSKLVMIHRASDLYFRSQEDNIERRMKLIQILHEKIRPNLKRSEARADQQRGEITKKRWYRKVAFKTRFLAFAFSALLGIALWFLIPYEWVRYHRQQFNMNLVTQQEFSDAMNHWFFRSIAIRQAVAAMKAKANTRHDRQSAIRQLIFLNAVEAIPDLFEVAEDTAEILSIRLGAMDVIYVFIRDNAYQDQVVYDRLIQLLEDQEFFVSSHARMYLDSLPNEVPQLREALYSAYEQKPSPKMKAMLKEIFETLNLQLPTPNRSEVRAIMSAEDASGLRRTDPSPSTRLQKVSGRSRAETRSEEEMPKDPYRAPQENLDEPGSRGLTLGAFYQYGHILLHAATMLFAVVDYFVGITPDPVIFLFGALIFWTAIDTFSSLFSNQDNMERKVIGFGLALIIVGLWNLLDVSRAIQFVLGLLAHSIVLSVFTSIAIPHLKDKSTKSSGIQAEDSKKSRSEARAKARLKWRNDQNQLDLQVGVESIRGVLRRELPDLMFRFDSLSDSTPQEEIDLLISDIYRLSAAKLKAWGVNAAFNRNIVPYFKNDYKFIYLNVFKHPLLKLSRFGFGSEWLDDEGNPSESLAMGSIIYTLRNEIPRILERYEAIDDQTTEEELKLLRRDIYRIKGKHIRSWGLKAALNKDKAPYFNGSYITALMRVFDNPRLKLERLGFRLQWLDGEKKPNRRIALASLDYVLRRRIPKIIERYESIDSSTSQTEIDALRDEIYEIRAAHFNSWGLSASMSRDKAPFWGGSYIEALADYFDNPILGFDAEAMRQHRVAMSSVIRFHWKEGLGYAKQVVREALRLYYPDIMERYDALSEHTAPAALELLREDIYEIQKSDFDLWHMGAALSQESAPYFSGRYEEALVKSLDHPVLQLNPLGFTYQWKDSSGEYSRELSLESMRYGLRREMPSLMQRYSQISDATTETELELIRREIYQIDFSRIELWDLNHVRSVPFFEGSYKTALVATFDHPRLNLNRLGFGLEFTDPERALESVRYVLRRELPHVMKIYDSLSDDSDDEVIEQLREEIYRIKRPILLAWGLHRLFHLPYWKKYDEVLIAALDHPRLNLVKEGFARSEVRVPEYQSEGQRSEARKKKKRKPKRKKTSHVSTQSKQKSAPEKNFLQKYGFTIILVAVIGFFALAMVLVQNNGDNQRQVENRAVAGPVDEELGPWYDYKIENNLESVNGAIILALEELKKNGYGRPDVLDRYAELLKKARTLKADHGAWLLKTPVYDSPELKVSVSVNVSKLYHLYRGLKKIGSEDLYLEIFVSTIAREAWGVEVLEFSFDDMTLATGEFGGLSKIMSEKFKQSFSTKDPEFLQIIQNPKNAKLIRKMHVMMMSLEFFEAVNQLEAYLWLRYDAKWHSGQSVDFDLHRYGLTDVEAEQIERLRGMLDRYKGSYRADPKNPDNQIIDAFEIFQEEVWRHTRGLLPEFLQGSRSTSARALGLFTIMEMNHYGETQGRAGINPAIIRNPTGPRLEDLRTTTVSLFKDPKAMDENDSPINAETYYRKWKQKSLDQYHQSKPDGRQAPRSEVRGEKEMLEIEFIETGANGVESVDINIKKGDSLLKEFALGIYLPTIEVASRHERKIFSALAWTTTDDIREFISSELHPAIRQHDKYKDQIWPSKIFVIPFWIGFAGHLYMLISILSDFIYGRLDMLGWFLGLIIPPMAISAFLSILFTRHLYYSNEALFYRRMKHRVRNFILESNHKKGFYSPAERFGDALKELEIKGPRQNPLISSISNKQEVRLPRFVSQRSVAVDRKDPGFEKLLQELHSLHREMGSKKNLMWSARPWVIGGILIAAFFGLSLPGMGMITALLVSAVSLNLGSITRNRQIQNRAKASIESYLTSRSEARSTRLERSRSALRRTQDGGEKSRTRLALKPEHGRRSEMRAATPRQRASVFIESSSEFNANGIALTDEGKAIAAQLYQEALNEFQQRVSQIKEVDGEPVNVSLHLLFGGLADGKARLGVFPPEVNFKRAERIAILEKEGNKRSWPSDVDLRLNYGVSGLSKRAMDIHEAVNDISKDIYDQFGILIHEAPFVPQSAFTRIPVSTLIPDGLKTHLLRSEARANQIQDIEEARAKEIAREMNTRLGTGGVIELLPVHIGDQVFTVETNTARDPDNRVNRFLRIGPLFFIDWTDGNGMPSQETLSYQDGIQKYKDLLGELYEEHAANIFFVEPARYIDDFIQMKSVLGEYGILTIAQMLAQKDEFQGAITADFGTGREGLLGRVALRMGARVIFNKYGEFRQDILDAEGWQEGIFWENDYEVIEGDLNDPRFLKALKLDKWMQQVKIILMNIGQPDVYGKANENVITLITQNTFPLLSLLINSGFMKAQDGRAWRHELAVDRIEEALTPEGFEVTRYLYSVDQEAQVPNPKSIMGFAYNVGAKRSEMRTQSGDSGKIFDWKERKRALQNINGIFYYPASGYDDSFIERLDELENVHTVALNALGDYQKKSIHELAEYLTSIGFTVETYKEASRVIRQFQVLRKGRTLTLYFLDHDAIEGSINDLTKEPPSYLYVGAITGNFGMLAHEPEFYANQIAQLGDGALIEIQNGARPPLRFSEGDPAKIGLEYLGRHRNALYYRKSQHQDASSLLKTLQKMRSEARMDEQELIELIDQALQNPNLEIPLRPDHEMWITAVNTDFIRSHGEEFKTGINQLIDAVEPYRPLMDGMSYMDLAGAGGFHLEQRDVLILMAIGSVLGYWSVISVADEQNKQRVPGHHPILMRINYEALGRSEVRISHSVEPTHPIYLLKQPDLRKFIVQYLTKNYTHWGLPNDLAKNIIQTLWLHADNPDLARQIVYQEITSFKGDPKWDRAYALYRNHKYRDIVSILEPYLDELDPDFQILDLGAGANDLAYAIVQEYPDGTVIGTDPLGYHGSYIPSHGKRHPNVRFYDQPSATQLPREIPDGSLDAILMIASAHHVSDRQLPLILTENSRKLKLGGKVILVEDTYSLHKKIQESGDIGLTEKLLSLVDRYGHQFAEQFFTFMDWYGIILVHGAEDMAMPYHFRSMENWSERFRELGYDLTDMRQVGLPQHTFHNARSGVLEFTKRSEIRTQPEPKQLQVDLDLSADELIMTHPHALRYKRSEARAALLSTYDLADPKSIGKIVAENIHHVEFPAKYAPKIIPAWSNGVTINLYPEDQNLGKELDDIDLAGMLEWTPIPMGSIGRVEISLIEVDGKLAFYIELIQPSHSFRVMTKRYRDKERRGEALTPNEQLVKELQEWPIQMVDYALEVSKFFGLNDTYGKSKQLSQIQNHEMGHGIARSYYQLPFRDRFQSETVTYRNIFYSLDEIEAMYRNEIAVYGQKKYFYGGEVKIWRFDQRAANHTKRLEENEKHPIYAWLDDIDGNITSAGSTDVPRSIIDEYVKDLRLGRIRGLVSGRTETVSEANRKKSIHSIEEVAGRIRKILKKMPEAKDVMQNFLMFPDNGNYAVWYEWDEAAQDFVRQEKNLASRYGLVKEGFEFDEGDQQQLYEALTRHLEENGFPEPFKFIEHKRSSFASWLNDTGHGWDAEERSRQANKMAEVIQKYFDHHPEYKHLEAVATTVTVDIAIKGTNKSLAIRYVAETFGLEDHEIATFDDKASRQGNGYPFTERVQGYSTNEYDPESQYQVALALVLGVTGLKARRIMHDRLRFLPLHERSEVRATHQEKVDHMFSLYERFHQRYREALYQTVREELEAREALYSEPQAVTEEAVEFKINSRFDENIIERSQAEHLAFRTQLTNTERRDLFNMFTVRDYAEAVVASAAHQVISKRRQDLTDENANDFMDELLDYFRGLEIDAVLDKSLMKIYKIEKAPVHTVWDRLNAFIEFLESTKDFIEVRVLEEGERLRGLVIRETVHELEANTELMASFFFQRMYLLTKLGNFYGEEVADEAIERFDRKPWQPHRSEVRAEDQEIQVVEGMDLDPTYDRSLSKFVSQNSHVELEDNVLIRLERAQIKRIGPVIQVFPGKGLFGRLPRLGPYLNKNRGGVYPPQGALLQMFYRFYKLENGQSFLLIKWIQPSDGWREAYSHLTSAQRRLLNSVRKKTVETLAEWGQSQNIPVFALTPEAASELKKRESVTLGEKELIKSYQEPFDTMLWQTRYLQFSETNFPDEPLPLHFYTRSETRSFVDVYPVRLERVGNNEWVSHTTTGSVQFEVMEGSNKTPQEHRERFAKLFGEFIEAKPEKAVERRKLLRFIDGQLSRSFAKHPKEPVALLIDRDFLVGYYLYGRHIYVMPQYRGTGAVDVLLEDMVERRLKGNRNRKFKYRIARESERATKIESKLGTLDEFRADIGLKSYVKVEEESYRLVGEIDEIEEFISSLVENWSEMDWQVIPNSNRDPTAFVLSLRAIENIEDFGVTEEEILYFLAEAVEVWFPSWNLSHLQRYKTSNRWGAFIALDLSIQSDESRERSEVRSSYVEPIVPTPHPKIEPETKLEIGDLIIDQRYGIYAEVTYQFDDHVAPFQKATVFLTQIFGKGAGDHLTGELQHFERSRELLNGAYYVRKEMPVKKTTELKEAMLVRSEDRSVEEYGRQIEAFFERQRSQYQDEDNLILFDTLHYYFLHFHQHLIRKKFSDTPFSPGANLIFDYAMWAVSMGISDIVAHSISQERDAIGMDHKFLKQAMGSFPVLNAIEKHTETLPDDDTFASAYVMVYEQQFKAMIEKILAFDRESFKSGFYEIFTSADYLQFSQIRSGLIDEYLRMVRKSVSDYDELEMFDQALAIHEAQTLPVLHQRHGEIFDQAEPFLKIYDGEDEVDQDPRSEARSTRLKEPRSALRRTQDGGEKSRTRLALEPERSRRSEVRLTIDSALEALHPVIPAALTTNQRFRIADDVIEISVENYADRMIRRLEEKLLESEIVNPAAAQDFIREMIQVIHNLKNQYAVGYTAQSDNQNFIDAIRNISGMVKQVVVDTTKQKVTPDLSSALKELEISYTSTGNLNRASRSLSLTLDSHQKAVGLVAAGEIAVDLNSKSVFVPIGSAQDSEFSDPFLESAVIAAQTVVALLLAEEAKDDARKRKILANPAALLKQYDLFSGFENQVLTANGRGGITISTQAIRDYIATQAVERSA